MIPSECLEEALALELSGCQVSLATAPALQGTTFASITQAGVSRGSATLALAKHLKIKPENLMGVGDSVGDLPMLEVVGHPVVMANTDPALKEKFAFVAGDVERCGVVEALEEALKIPTV